MEFLLKNCPTCHRLMVRSWERKVCKACHKKQQEIAEGTVETEATAAPEVVATASIEETVEQVVVLCHHCGGPSDIPGPFCFRCRLHIAKRARDATRDLSAKLDRVPTARGSGRFVIEGSRSHVLDIIGRSRRRRSGSRSYTPTTKYSS